MIDPLDHIDRLILPRQPRPPLPPADRFGSQRRPIVRRSEVRPRRWLTRPRHRGLPLTVPSRDQNQGTGDSNAYCAVAMPSAGIVERPGSDRRECSPLRDPITRQQRLILLAAILGSSIVTLDSSVVSVALPAIERDLGGGLSAQQWVSNAYLLTLGSFILIGGSLGDIYGERRVFSIGLAGFGVFSLCCALAPTIGVLLVARALQGA